MLVGVGRSVAPGYMGAYAPKIIVADIHIMFQIPLDGKNVWWLRELYAAQPRARRWRCCNKRAVLDLEGATKPSATWIDTNQEILATNGG